MFAQHSKAELGAATGLCSTSLPQDASAEKHKLNRVPCETKLSLGHTKLHSKKRVLSKSSQKPILRHLGVKTSPGRQIVGHRVVTGLSQSSKLESKDDIITKNNKSQALVNTSILKKVSPEKRGKKRKSTELPGLEHISKKAAISRTTKPRQNPNLTDPGQTTGGAWNRPNGNMTSKEKAESKEKGKEHSKKRTMGEAFSSIFKSAIGAIMPGSKIKKMDKKEHTLDAMGRDVPTGSKDKSSDLAQKGAKTDKLDLKASKVTGVCISKEEGMKKKEPRTPWMLIPGESQLHQKDALAIQPAESTAKTVRKPWTQFETPEGSDMEKDLTARTSGKAEKGGVVSKKSPRIPWTELENDIKERNKTKVVAGAHSRAGSVSSVSSTSSQGNSQRKSLSPVGFPSPDTVPGKLSIQKKMKSTKSSRGRTLSLVTSGYGGSTKGGATLSRSSSVSSVSSVSSLGASQKKFWSPVSFPSPDSGGSFLNDSISSIDSTNSVTSTASWAEYDRLDNDDSGEKDRYTFFYSNKSPFSNHHPADFTLDGIHFTSTEQHMMYHKAVLFNDKHMAKEILKTSCPKQQKKFGRQVQNFDKHVWAAKCRDIVYEGCKAKFSQNPELYNELMATQGTILVEAAPRDRLWGIGMGAANPKAQNKKTWRGRNWLGYTLTKLRDDLYAERQ